MLIGFGLWLLVTEAPAVRAHEAEFIYPTDGATNVSATDAFRWTRVAGAEAYYLYVGTSPGAKDLWDSGATQETSYQGPTLPAGQRLHARLNLKFDGDWSSSVDITFTTDSIAAFIYPAKGQTTVDTSDPFQWTAVAGARSYKLNLGSAPGRDDYVSTGEITATSYTVPELPSDRLIYGRIYTKMGAKRVHTDTSFTVPSKAMFVHPARGAANVDLSRPFQWTAVPGAEVYVLLVGTDVGKGDLVDTTEITTTSYDVSGLLPLGRVLFARIWTKKAGVGWLKQDITFTGAQVVASLLYPRDGQVRVDPATPFRWTRVVDRHAKFKLSVGTSPGGTDLLETGEISQTSYRPRGLPPGRTLYARVWTQTRTAWRHEDAAFVVSATVEPARILVPTDGAADADAALPFRWTSVDVARGYRLRVGTSPGGGDIHDSGTIGVTRRFVSDVPIGVPLFGRIETLIDGTWHATDFIFTARARSNPQDAMARRIESALWATGVVRQMADLNNLPYTWTELAGVRRRRRAYCSDYAVTLLSVLEQMNITSARRLDLIFNNNGADTHVAVELRDTVSNKWIVLDPTFGLAPKRSSDGGWATAEQVQQATRTRRWGEITYEFLGPYGDQIARDYYLDYPLLYLNVYHQGTPIPPGQVESVLPYLEEIAVPTSGPRSGYVVQCLEGAATTLLVDEGRTTVRCSGVDSLSSAFSASAIGTDGRTRPFKLYSARPRRHVFPAPQEPQEAAFVYPTNGAAIVDLSRPFEWTAVPGAEAYYLYVGTGVGRYDLVDTGAILATTYHVGGLPPEQTLYARISTKKAGIGWLHQDITFTVARQGK